MRQRDDRGRLVVSCALKTEVCRGPVELRCEGENHARDSIYFVRVGRITKKIFRIGLDYLSKMGQDWIMIGLLFLNNLDWIGLFKK